MSTVMTLSSARRLTHRRALGVLLSVNDCTVSLHPPRALVAEEPQGGTGASI